jgi:isopentenyl-diphosphate Delta-isomerase
MILDRGYVITVNEKDEETGTMEKMEAHEKGVLHRAFSVFILNDQGELLVHQRAEGKYHSGGLWTNTCCSHPMPGEDTLSAAKRRTKEEMGIEAELEPMFSFIYRAEVGNGLIEHELDHVLSGIHNGPCSPDPEEVKDHRYLPLAEIKQWIEQKPEDFTAWMRIIFPRVSEELAKKRKV